MKGGAKYLHFCYNFVTHFQHGPAILDSMKNNTMRLAAEAMIPALILIAACMFKAMSLWAVDASPVRVYPNPWRSDRHAAQSVTFDGLPLGSSVKLFTVSGRLVKTLTPAITSATWDLANDKGDKVASGIYLYLITVGNSGDKARGKVVVIK